MILTKICKVCDKEFEKPIVESLKHWNERRQYCSCECHFNDMAIYGGRLILKCKTCNKEFRPKGKRKITGQYCSISCSKKGKIPPNLKIAQSKSPIQKGNTIASCLKGRKRPSFSKEWLEKIHKAKIEQGKNHSREKHWNWKGGVSEISHMLRRKEEYIVWRQKVYKRDRWTCQSCDEKPKRIIAHHIKNFRNYPELRHKVDNGITLCRACHIQVHKDDNNKLITVN